MSANVVHRIVQDYLKVEAELGKELGPDDYYSHGKYHALITRYFGGWDGLVRAAKRQGEVEASGEDRLPKILLFDLETAPMELLGFGLFDQNFSLNQIKRDWFLLSFSAKWLGNPAIFYADQSKEEDITDDTRLLKMLWHLLDEADLVVTQNGKSFDEKVANARFIIKGFQPPSPFKHIDTRQLAKRRFRFTSTKLEYMANALNVDCKKSAHKKFPGFDLWKECLARNPEAWEEMRAYNIADTLALEGVYLKLRGWGTPGVDLNLFHGDPKHRCASCGSRDLELPEGKTEAKSAGVYKLYRCRGCGKWGAAKGEGNNLLSERKKMSLRGPGEG